MRLRIFGAGLLACVFLIAADKRLPQGQAGDATVSISATVLGPDQVKEAVGSNFGNQFTVLQLTVTPKGGKQIALQLDDFQLRSESDGDRSGPLAASQIAGEGALVVTRTYAPRTGPDNPQILAGTKVEMQDTAGHPELVEALKKQMLAEKTITQPESGLLFFPLEKKKAKNLVLTYAPSPDAKLHVQFK